MARQRVLFICGSMNQTTQMHQIAEQLPEYDNFFTPYYADGVVEIGRRCGLAEFTILGRRLVRRCLHYLESNNLRVDFRGESREYDLVVLCTDLFVPQNVRKSRLLLVQEGMTDPENFAFHLVRNLRFLPLWLASTSTTGLSDRYDRFCVASEGYRELFIRKGVRPEKLVVTGIPNFDNCKKYLDNDFPHRNFVLACTSDTRETMKFDSRRKFLQKVGRIAGGRQLIFKLHPNENSERSRREIEKYLPGALVYSSGSAEEMIANCDTLITQYSSTTFVGLALGKQVHSYFDMEELRWLMPAQNGAAAQNIADVCHQLMQGELPARSHSFLAGWGVARVTRERHRRRTGIAVSEPPGDMNL